jgi:hypothetical protein
MAISRAANLFGAARFFKPQGDLPEGLAGLARPAMALAGPVLEMAWDHANGRLQRWNSALIESPRRAKAGKRDAMADWAGFEGWTPRFFRRSRKVGALALLKDVDKN